MPPNSSSIDAAYRSHGGPSSSSSSSTSPIQAPPIIPPPLYALVTPGLHRCSAIGLEEVLNEAWGEVHAQILQDKDAQGSSSNGERRDASTVKNDNKRSSQSRSRRNGAGEVDSVAARSSQSSESLSPSIIARSPLLSFLSALRLHTIIYLSPSLLPASLLKLCRDLNLSLLQWDLEGGKVWRVRQGAQKDEKIALHSFSRVGQQRSEDDLIGLDLTSMSKATLEIILNLHCSGILICDPSGLSETSLVIGCLRRMMRWNFASVCLEYRAFAPTRLSTTANHLRFIELFPLESLDLPDWPDLVPWAARALRLVQQDFQDEDKRVADLDE
ncbi:unnamed protein product [Sympodiomycopsis kandeliae]